MNNIADEFFDAVLITYGVGVSTADQQRFAAALARDARVAEVAQAVAAQVRARGTRGVRNRRNNVFHQDMVLHDISDDVTDVLRTLYTVWLQFAAGWIDTLLKRVYISDCNTSDAAVPPFGPIHTRLVQILVKNTLEGNDACAEHLRACGGDFVCVAKIKDVVESLDTCRQNLEAHPKAYAAVLCSVQHSVSAFLKDDNTDMQGCAVCRFIEMIARHIYMSRYNVVEYVHQFNIHTRRVLDFLQRNARYMRPFVPVGFHEFRLNQAVVPVPGNAPHHNALGGHINVAAHVGAKFSQNFRSILFQSGAREAFAELFPDTSLTLAARVDDVLRDLFDNVFRFVCIIVYNVYLLPVTAAGRVAARLVPLVFLKGGRAFSSRFLGSSPDDVRVVRCARFMLLVFVMAFLLMLTSQDINDAMREHVTHVYAATVHAAATITQIDLEWVADSTRVPRIIQTFLVTKTAERAVRIVDRAASHTPNAFVSAWDAMFRGVYSLDGTRRLWSRLLKSAKNEVK